jgi:hypothetical protein
VDAGTWLLECSTVVAAAAATAWSAVVTERDAGLPVLLVLAEHRCNSASQRDVGLPVLLVLAG